MNKQNEVKKEVEKNKKASVKKPQPKKKNAEQKIKSAIQAVQSSTNKKQKSKKVDVKNIIDKVLIGIMAVQVLFLVYYFFGF